MATIPKKAIERFVKAVPRFQKVLQIAKDRDVNESDTVSILNDIFGDVFGYDKYLEVTSEVAIRGTYCDLALKVDNKIQFLVEVKAIGIELKEAHLRQAIDYGANQGIPWVILSNGVDWRVYRIRFEQPIDHDLVCSFNFLSLNLRDTKQQGCLFMLSKEGLAKNVREDFFDKFQSVNRYMIGNLILGDAVLGIITKQLKRMSEGVKIEVAEVEHIIRNEVLKREIVEGEEADSARARVNKFFRKESSRRRVQKEATPEESSELPAEIESVSERLLREAEEECPEPKKDGVSKEP